MAFPVVAIGASAGGLEAVTELLGALPSSSAMAFVVVQHLDPEHQSLLPEILATKTAMPVAQIHDGSTVAPGHVYVIPPNTTLTLTDGHLRLARRPAGRHMPVDALFVSVAEELGGNAIGAVLSGADSDGTLGLQAIKHGGGITFAQEPSSARFPSMPRSAIETGCVDFVLRPRDIARELLRLGSHPYLQARDAPNASPPEAVPAEEESLRRVFRRLHTAHGVDFTHYKHSTLRRRLARRMAVQRTDELTAYVAMLESDPAEVAALYQDFLIRVTGFFRDPEAFEGLSSRVFPKLCEGRSPKDPFRIWVPGCASGEEVYSIAIALVEYLSNRASPAGIQLFGTDVSETAIEKARAAHYADTIAQDVSSERLERFFVKQNDHYLVAKHIRDLCIFARQDVTRDPPFSRLDLVSCRNLLIYLDAAAQHRVMQTFHYALRPQRFLILGPSESVGVSSQLFELVDKHHRIYSRSTTTPAPSVERDFRGATLRGRTGDPAISDDPALIETDSAQHEADRLLLARYAPASLLVDETLNILQFRGETGRFLEHASGPPSLNLRRVARPELLVEIAPAIQEARETGSAVQRDGLSVDDLSDVTLDVIPLQTSSAERCFLIVFEEGSRRPSDRRAQNAVGGALPESEKDRRLVQLEREIASTRDYLQSTMEEHEAVKEELKSAHEEVLSANEEFQSTNEELETAKEELQSANEELSTTNDELRSRNHELSALNEAIQKARATSDRAREYADIIVDTVRDPMLVLDDEMRIRRANQAFHAAFDTTRETTVGRLLRETGTGELGSAALIRQLHEVLEHDTTIDGYDVSYSQSALGTRTMRLNARRIPGDGERAELVLLAIEDVTERQASADHLRNDIRHKDEFLAMLAHELRNPLTPIINAVHLLRRGDSGATPTKLYDMIERQTLRLVRLVDELLDVARISRGLIELARESVDLVEIAQRAAEVSRPRIEERRQTLSLAVPDAPLWVDGDPVRLEQVVSNLLDNAVKYTEPGGRIALQLCQRGGEAVLSVRDNGIGLAPDVLESIFDLFSQVDSSLARSDGGLGVGLNLARRVVELHGGRIEARSAGPDQGSEFIVGLPVQVPGTPRSELHEPTTPATSGVRPRRVLIVDDNADSAESTALLARSWGHEVGIARDGPSALELAERLRPEFALVDIGLPGMDGYELARRLRKRVRNGDLYLVAMTGYGREQDREAARAAGFAAHLVKPAIPDELRRLLTVGGTEPSD